MLDGQLDRARASPPSSILDLSSTNHGVGVCFLLIFKKEGGTLADLTLVSGDAVFSTSISEKGLEGCVYKPPSRKSLKTNDHIAKIGQALEAVAACDAAVAAAAAGGGGSPSSATATTAAPKVTATLALEIGGKDSAKLTVKEVKSLGAVDLAVVTLPATNETGDGSLLRRLLLGAVVEAHKRTHGAEAMRRDRDKARKEQVKVQGLLDGAIRDKRKTVTNILEKAVLVVNAKKDRIDQLEEKIERLEENGGGSGDEEASICGSGGSRGGEGDDDVRADDDEGRAPPPATGTKRKGKATASRAQLPGARGSEASGQNKGLGSGSSGKDDDDANTPKGTTAAGGGTSSPSARRPGRGRGGGAKVKIKAEPELGTGGGALATPMGTQELSQDELLELVDSKVKTEGAGAVSVDRNYTGNDTSRRRNQRGGGGSGSSLKHPRDSSSSSSSSEEEEEDGMGDGGCREAAMYVGNLGDTSESEDDGCAGQASQRVRRRRKIKKSGETVAGFKGSSSGGGSSSSVRGSGTAVATGHTSGGGSGSGAATESKGRGFWEELTADSDEDLAGLK
eukprot:g17664.t1